MASVAYRELINRRLAIQERGCGSKCVFVTRREAQSYVRNGRRSDGTLVAYRCGVCGLWHLGHRGLRR